MAATHPRMTPRRLSIGAIWVESAEIPERVIAPTGMESDFIIVLI